MSTLTAANRESITSLALPLVAVFVVSLGYGVVLPVLPFVLADALGEAERTSIPWHTGMLTGVYMLVLFLFAPLWGYISDRIGRRTVILIGLAGFSVAMLWFALARGLVFIYGARAFAGIFAAAVLPVVLAWVSDAAMSRTRAQAFAWLSAASALGFMFGPALSGWLVSVKIVAQDTSLALPFYATAALGGGVWLAAYRFLPENASLCVRDSDPARSVPSLMGLLALSLLVMFGLGSFEVGLTLLGQQVLNLEPREIGWAFVECSLVMIMVQVFVLAPLIQRVGSSLMAPAFLAMASGIALLPYAASFPALLIGVGLIAAASGMLIPALTYLISLAAGSAPGAAIGKQTAAGSLGYAVGSSAAGWLFAVHIAVPFWVAAGLLGLGAVAAFRVANTLKSIGSTGFGLKSERSE
ncbi:MAG: MFS transporter [Hydrogenophilales bacterium]|nr:MFS transporter [Hydrogenophilales bacterium]